MSSLVDPNATNITGAFGGALTTALDVMTITHELDLNASAQTKPKTNSAEALQKKKEAVTTDQIALNNQLNTLIVPNAKEPPSVLTGASVFGTLTQLNDSKMDQSIPIPPQSKLFAKILSTPMDYSEPVDDPFRELVLSKRNTDPNKLKELANRAANLENIEEVPSKPPATVKSIAGIFAGTDTFVKKVEETIKKKYAALEPSDSEGYGEAPLLGRIARTRRAKSATQRSSAKLKADKKKLIRGSDSSSSETMNNGEQDASDLEYAADRIKQVKESIINKQDVYSTNLRPLFLDLSAQNDDV